MVERLLMQYLTLTIYTFFVGFCFCDGFKLHILRKLSWFLVFLLINVYIFNTTGEFDLTQILPVPTLFAILLCNYERRKSKLKNK